MYVLEQPDPAVVPYYREAVVYYAIASVVYLISEPFYVISQILLFARLKVCSIYSNNFCHNSTCNFLVLHVRRLMQCTTKTFPAFVTPYALYVTYNALLLLPRNDVITSRVC